MRVLLMRHGQAAGPGADPPLSPRGEAAVRGTAAGPWPVPARIVHSPLLRARGTAGLLAERWPGAQRIEEPTFVPEAGVEGAARRLLELAAGQGVVVLVSHLPLLPGLCEWLCGTAIAFEPADAVLLEADEALAWRETFARSAP